MHQLSKSTYLRGLKCHKSLHLNKYHKNLRDEMSDAQETIFARGTDVGELAQQLFPNGKDATPENYYDFSKALDNTKQWIEEGVEVVYEAAFQYHGVLAALDILVQRDGRYYAYEVKSSTEVKEYHMDDASLQHWVIKGCGIKLEDFSIVYINNEYVKDGDVDVHNLFTIESVLVGIKEYQDSIPGFIDLMKMTLEQSETPEMEIGPHCLSPFGCDFMGHCWKHIPEKSVFDIAYISNRAWDLYDDDILKIKDIPDDFHLQDRQKAQVQGEKTGEEVFDTASIKSFLDEWQFPLYFFDFETIGPAVPLYDGTRPYNQYPFQYSLHIMQEDGQIEHFEYLGNTNEDPRPELITSMLKELGKSGSIVTYNMGFEKGKISNLAKDFPKSAKELLALNERVVDLIIPFRSHWCYKKEMDGRSSIKKVLPALIPDLTYKDLNIQEGGTASNTYLAMCEGTFEGDVEKTKQDLLDYCKLDTWAMVMLYNHLLEQLKMNEYFIK